MIGRTIFQGEMALWALIIERQFSMILVGYLVEAAPRVLIWWGGFHFLKNGSLTPVTYKNSFHRDTSRPPEKARDAHFYPVLFRGE